MFTTINSPYLVAADSFDLAQCPAQPPKNVASADGLKRQLKQSRKTIAELQHRLYAEDKRSLLLIFQAMDAAGKDSTIRAVMKGVNPAGCQVYSFKKPSSNELDHDFLWRTTKAMPQRGCIGVFNRSYYEEALVVRVHPEYLGYQRLPEVPDSLDELWQQRFESIESLEKHMARNGTVILKFWLNVSKDEQKQRFLSRLDEPEKHWKFAAGDIDERERWDDYMQAYEAVISATSKPSAPWFAIPADDKLYMRATVADIIARTLEELNPQFPEVKQSEKEMFAEMRERLES